MREDHPLGFRINSDHLSFPWLIHPISSEVFFSEFWEKQTLVVGRNSPDYFQHLLSIPAVDSVIATLNLSYPEISLVNAQNAVTSAQYVLSDGRVDLAKFYELFAQGSTIIINQLHRRTESLAVLCRAMEQQFSFPFQTNVYLSPPEAQGFKPHYDTHDVFVLQITNSKRWLIYDDGIKLPLPGQDFDSSVHRGSDIKEQFELNAGDVAYIPRGVIHEARASSYPSLHITLGVLTYSWLEFCLEALCSFSLQNVDFRRALPVNFAASGFDRTSAKRWFSTLLQRFTAEANFDSAFDAFVAQLALSQRPLLFGQLQQISRLNNLSLDDVLRCRNGLLFRLSAEGARLRLQAHGKEITFPAYLSETLEFVLSKREFRVRDLPGPFDNDGRLILVRRLVREGIIVFCRNMAACA